MPKHASSQNPLWQPPINAAERINICINYIIIATPYMGVLISVSPDQGHDGSIAYTGFPGKADPLGTF